MSAFASPAWVAARDMDITRLSAIELSTAIRLRQVSCVEVMRAYLNRIERLNPVTNAIILQVPAEQALAEAAERDRDLERGHYRGWMHGFPQAIKDLADVEGMPTTRGSPILREAMAGRDSIFVARMRSAGAIFIGKTNVPEFGLGSHTYNTVFGTTLNPWDTTKSAGGSSGGAAAALALDLLPVADGSDMMGSLRNPAGWNNVIGFRPSLGRIPNNRGQVLHHLAVSGPMARNVPDLAMLLSTMAGRDARDPFSLTVDPGQFAGPIELDVRGKRVGWLGSYDGYLPMQDGVLETCERALQDFERLGCIVSPVKVDFDMDRLWHAWLTLRSWFLASRMQGLYANEATRALLKPEVIWELERGLALNAMQVAEAGDVRDDWYQAVRRLFESHDFLVLPTAQLFPFEASQAWPRQVGTKEMDTYHRWMEVVVGGTLSGCPIVAVPAGFSADGLPMGLQLMGPAQGDWQVLQLAAAYEKECGWTAGRHRPPLTG